MLLYYQVKSATRNKDNRCSLSILSIKIDFSYVSVIIITRISWNGAGQHTSTWNMLHHKGSRAEGKLRGFPPNLPNVATHVNNQCHHVTLPHIAPHCPTLSLVPSSVIAPSNQSSHILQHPIGSLCTPLAVLIRRFPF